MPTASQKKLITDNIRGVPDFPKKGILFWDITTLCLNPTAFQQCIDLFVERYKGKQIDVVAGFEARGFIFGPPIALALGAGFVCLRKPGKLPGKTIGADYQLEYGVDRIEMHEGHVQPGNKVLLIDDLIATGGTMAAGIKLMKQVDANIVEAACVIEMPDLKGRDKLDASKVPLFVLVEKEGA
eukprot:jgi/Astpho2/134/Aster-04599